MSASWCAATEDVEEREGTLRRENQKLTKCEARDSARRISTTRLSLTGREGTDTTDECVSIRAVLRVTGDAQR